MVQVKRVMQWLLRIFFSSTIGFAVPVKIMFNAATIQRSLLFFLPVFGKLLTGILATPLNIEQALTVGLSMSV
jgi:hypothetical protein